MIVATAKKIPPAVRGRMKLWFIEPVPGVYVSGLNDSVSQRVIEYLEMHCPRDSGLMIFRSKSQAPGYEIRTMGNMHDCFVDFCGMQLIRSNRQCDL